MANDTSDTTGEEYYRWTVLEHRKAGMSLCRCACGTEREVRNSSLRHGKSKSCGCFQKETASKLGRSSVRNLTGKIFGRLVVIDRNGSNNHRRAVWRCHCECGEVVEISSDSLLSGKTQSCGCLQKEIAAERLFNPDISDEERALAADRDLNPQNAKWRTAVYERDGYTCQACGDDRGGNLVAHHKDGYHWCHERRYDVDNGVTVCTECHDSFHHNYGNADNTEKQWGKFVRGMVPKERIKTEKKEYDISGNQYNHLFVIRREGLMTDNHIRYLCRCDCGKEVYVSSGALKAGQKSCGCQKGELIRASKFKDLTGMRFGVLVVRRLDESREQRDKWICDCGCGNTRSVYRTHLTQGKVVDCESVKNDNTCRLRRV